MFLLGRVYIAGVGLTKVGDHWGKSITDLAVEAGFKTLQMAHPVQPDHVVVGNMFSAYSSRQEHLGALVANGLGLTGLPAYKVEAACASGGAAANVGYNLVKSGEAQAVLVIGVEKMRDLEPAEVSEALCMAESAEYTQFFGASFVSLNALLARLYMQEYNVSRDELSSIPVLAHKNASTAEHAQFTKTITTDDVARSMMVSDPLRLLDCAPVGDGAAAILMVSEGNDQIPASGMVEVLSSVVATSRFSFYERDDMLDLDATKQAAQRALKAAGISISDVDFVEVHDAFSVIGALSLEALGFSKKGEGARDAKAGRFDREGTLPVNTFGGLKARGHPVGATGIYQLAEAFLQLTRKAGQNQVKRARYALAQNIGGVDTTATVHVLAKGRK